MKINLIFIHLYFGFHQLFLNFQLISSQYFQMDKQNAVAMNLMEFVKFC